ncbi:MAG: glycosyltransferase family 39 protein [Verrucomicrobiia bacterium]
MEGSARVRTTVVLCAFTVAFTALTVGSYTHESATVDEPQHLTAGYTALRLHDYRIDPEHPPFLRLWAALPLLAMPEVRIDTNSPSWSAADAWKFSHRFLYELNDADHLLYRARFMTVLLGILLGILVFSWARELFGFWTAATILALYCVEPNILAHSSLVTTDLGLTCFGFGALYFLWRTTRRLTGGNVAGVAAFFALAQVSKFSALLLGPIVLVLLVVRALRTDPWPCRITEGGDLRSRRAKLLVSLAVAAVLALASYVAVWAAYGFRYGTITPSDDLRLVREDTQFLQSVHMVARVADWLDKHQLVPNAYAQSFILGQVKTQHRTAYLAGRTSRTGWWYYFLAAFLVKTPLTILLLLVCGLVLLIQEPVRWRTNAAFLVFPPAIFLGAAMMAHLNIGLRHILPVYPFALLIAGVTLDEMRAKWRAGVLLVPVALACVELATVYPHCLAFFNQIIGGPGNGHLVLLDSNLDWGQDLKPLKRWMDAHHVEVINLSYFGTADPGYYGIRWAGLPGMMENMAPTVSGPRLPGYVAVSVQNLHDVHRVAPAPDFFTPLLERTPAAVIGYSIHVYWVETNWWYNPRP